MKKIRRKGVAPLEFAMILPVFVGFLLLFLAVAKVQSAVMHARLETVSQIAQQRVDLTAHRSIPQENWPGPQDSSLVELLRGFERETALRQGILQAQATRETTDGERVIEAQGPAHALQIELADSWQNLMQFPAERADQKPLTFPKSITAYDETFREFDRFRELLEISGPGGNVRNYASFSSRFNQAPNDLQRGLRQIEAEIRSIEQRLSAASDPDGERALRDRLQRLRSTRDRLVKALRIAQE